MGLSLEVTYVSSARISVQHALAATKHLTSPQASHYVHVMDSYIRAARIALSRAKYNTEAFKLLTDITRLVRQTPVNPIYIQQLLQKTLKLLFILEGTLQRRHKRSA